MGITKTRIAEGTSVGEMFPTYAELEVQIEEGRGIYVFLEEFTEENTYQQEFTLIRVDSESKEEVNDLQIWVESLGLTEPTIVMWRESDSTGTIIETGGEYDFGDTDRLFLYFPMPIQNITFSTTSGSEVGVVVFPNCVELHVNYKDAIIGRYEIICQLKVESNGTIYKQEFMLVRPEE